MPRLFYLLLTLGSARVRGWPKIALCNSLREGDTTLAYGRDSRMVFFFRIFFTLKAVVRVAFLIHLSKMTSMKVI